MVAICLSSQKRIDASILMESHPSHDLASKKGVSPSILLGVKRQNFIIIEKCETKVARVFKKMFGL
jgi:hypothetical protein